ncbi:MAG: sensor histidine kinase [Vicinamibacterales bacterium]
MTLPLRARLLAGIAVMLGALLLGLSVVSYEALARALDHDSTERLEELSNGLHGYLRFENGTASVVFDPADNDEAAFVQQATRYYQIYDAADGHLMAESGLAPFGLELTPSEVQAFRADPKPFDITTEYGRLRLSNNPGTTPDGRAYLLQVGASLAPMDQTLGRYRSQLLWRVPVALLFTLVVAWWLSAFALSPLAALASAASGITVESLGRRLPVRGTDDELDRIATVFNDALARLEQSVGDMRQFASALAHELRTPLTALRGEIELSLRRRDSDDAARRALASQLEEIDRLSRLIDHILTLARAESGQIRLRVVPVDLGEVVGSAVEPIRTVAEARSIDLVCETPDAVVVDGDAGWLQRLVLNLLDNALKYTEPNGRVVARVSRDGPLARIDVQDTGIGLSPDDARHVFEPFFRVDPARTVGTGGAGLGLSLVQWIAVRHGGAVTVESRLGQGSTFTVTLPIHRDAAPG